MRAHPLFAVGKWCHHRDATSAVTPAHGVTALTRSWRGVGAQNDRYDPMAVICSKAGGSAIHVLRSSWNSANAGSAERTF
jgi:hypothetical protein